MLVKSLSNVSATSLLCLDGEGLLTADEQDLMSHLRASDERWRRALLAIAESACAGENELMVCAPLHLRSRRATLDAYQRAAAVKGCKRPEDCVRPTGHHGTRQIATYNTRDFSALPA